MVYSNDGTLLGFFAVDGRPQGISVTPAGLIAVIDTEGKNVWLSKLGGA